MIAIFDCLIMQISNFEPVSMKIFALMGNEKAVTAMAEYIEREAALALVRPDAPEDEKAAVTIATAKKLVRDIVQRAPTADVAPVVHAHWAHLGGDEWCCSACGFVITTEGSWDKPTKKYCVDCGARMDDVE